MYKKITIILCLIASTFMSNCMEDPKYKQVTIKIEEDLHKRINYKLKKHNSDQFDRYLQNLIQNNTDGRNTEVILASISKFNVKQLNAIDSNGNTALHAAAIAYNQVDDAYKLGFEQIFMALVERKVANLRNNDGHNAFYYLLSPRIVTNQTETTSASNSSLNANTALVGSSNIISVQQSTPGASPLSSSGQNNQTKIKIQRKMVIKKIIKKYKTPLQIIGTGLAVIATGAALYFGYKYFNKGTKNIQAKDMLNINSMLKI